MSKFNSTTENTSLTTNQAGGKAYTLSAKNKLVTMVLTSFFNETKYYGDNSKAIVDTARQVIKEDAKFVANLAIYAREVFNLRSISHVLIGELAKAPAGKKFVRQATKKVVQRADDMTEILSYYLATFKAPIPNSLKKGLADSFKKFDEYSLAKYKGDGKQIGLKNVLCISHPKPENEEQSKLWKKLLENKLEVPVTWETELSAKGNKKEVWEQLVDNKNLGYMATLRNVRNMLQAGISKEHVEKVANYLSNEKAVENSKQLPFRFFSAFRELQAMYLDNLKPITNAIQDALEISVKNMPRLEGTTLYITDNSGSMGTKLSSKSTVSYNDVATLLMAMASKISDNAITSVFGERFQIVNANDKDSILTNMNTFKNTHVGHSTNLYTAFEYIIRNKLNVDRIVIFSDLQAYTDNSYSYGNSRSMQSYLNEYKKTVNKDVIVHSVDLAGYGTSQFAENNVNLIAGWSEKLLEFISIAEQGTDNLLNKIATHYFK